MPCLCPGLPPSPPLHSLTAIAAKIAHAASFLQAAKQTHNSHEKFTLVSFWRHVLYGFLAVVSPVPTSPQSSFPFFPLAHTAHQFRPPSTPLHPTPLPSLGVVSKNYYMIYMMKQCGNDLSKPKRSPSAEQTGI